MLQTALPVFPHKGMEGEVSMGTCDGGVTPARGRLLLQSALGTTLSSGGHRKALALGSILSPQAA